MGKKYSFVSFVTNPLTFTLTINNLATSVVEFVSKYKTTYEFTTLVEKFSTTAGWILRLKISKIFISAIAHLLARFTATMKVNKIRILIIDSGLLSFVQNLKIKKIFIVANSKATEKWIQTVKLSKFLITNIFDELDRFTNTNLSVKKTTFIAVLIVGILHLLSYYDNEYGDGKLNSMDTSTLAQLDFSES